MEIHYLWPLWPEAQARFQWNREEPMFAMRKLPKSFKGRAEQNTAEYNEKKQKKDAVSFRVRNTENNTKIHLCKSCAIKANCVWSYIHLVTVSWCCA